MLRYTTRRVLISVPVLFGILLLSFVFVQMLPGDPMRALMSPEEAAAASPEYLKRRRAELGLDGTIWAQYVAWIREVLGGNLGYSFHRRDSVIEIIGERIGATSMLVGASVAIALPLGVVMGVLAALKKNSAFDYASAGVSMFAISIPSFFLGLSAIYIFSLRLGILPSGGMRTFANDNNTVVDTMHHLLLPACVLAAVLVGPYVRFTRQSMLEVLHQDHLVTARAKGVSTAGTVVRHGLRNALVPLTTVLAIQVPALLAGTVVIETIFAWPGVGRLVLEAITSRDYPVIIGVVLMSAVLVMLFNLFADLLAAVLDPRIRI
ncbi:ABC transporter permease [Phytoactinopolyspora alkaliphila]|uniref:ABC transporter permease n=1 Tax=Phytoactinopolyspora alkaliphila TaxID=1783498 RepID=A0A6N9YSJ6_9ACTN|nr:ABC transporter permease [Phytoactinopolyspora alkaliphila]NED97925.1 ABC transporter permease [Phytoactinopolyspora alkaliphila]